MSAVERALLAHRVTGAATAVSFQVLCLCGKWSIGTEHAAHQAQAVTEALGLVESWSYVFDGGDHDRNNLPGPHDIDDYGTRAEVEHDMGLEVGVEINGYPVERYFLVRRDVTPWRTAP